MDSNLHSGPGPFPGVIDMFGSGGRLFEHRAALLASRGFCVFALPLFAYEDLPNSLPDVSLDYLIVGLYKIYERYIIRFFKAAAIQKSFIKKCRYSNGIIILFLF